MDLDEFKRAINYFGEKNILGFGFDNTAGYTFTDQQPFSMAQYFREDILSLIFIRVDSHGNPFHVVKPIGTIQSIMIKDDSVPNIASYDRYSIRG